MNAHAISVQHQHPVTAGRRTWTCAHCHYVGVPTTFSRVSTAGWVLFIAGIILCVVFCWVPLLFCTSTHVRCPRCRIVGGET